jgi:hypothetical protein
MQDVLECKVMTSFPNYGSAADTPVFGTGGGIGTSVCFVSVDTPDTTSVSFSVCCDLDFGGGRDARKIFNDGSGSEDRFLRRCSLSSPGTSGMPAAADSTFHRRHKSPPATSMSSLRIVVDHFWCMSRVFLEPLAVVEDEMEWGEGGSAMGRTEVEFHFWPPCLLSCLPYFFYLDVKCRVGIPYTRQLFFHKMATK